MNRSKLRFRGLMALSCAAILTVLTLILSHEPAHAAQENVNYSAPVLFNQANTFARDGKPGLAILMYERARLLAPSDRDVAANEHFVRTHSGLPDAPPTGIGWIFGFASPNSFAWLGFIGTLLTGLSVMMIRLLPKRRSLFRATTTAGLVFGVFAIGSAVFAWPKMNEAVIIARESPARVSPVTIAATSFKLHEGEIVTVNAEGPDFVLVQATAGRSGWVARADLVRIVPQSNDHAQPTSSL